MVEDDSKSKVTKLLDSVTKDLPALVKENKGAVVGAVVGYFLADALSKNEGVVTAVLGALVGNVVDNKKKGK
jgi:outer membrane lipoprotein SlyB